MSGQLYKKVGKKFVPYNDPWAAEGLREGAWLVVVRPGNTTIRQRIQRFQGRETVNVALNDLKDLLVSEIAEAAKLRIGKEVLSPKEKEAWDQFKKTMGDDMPALFKYESAFQIVEDALDKFKNMREL